MIQRRILESKISIRMLAYLLHVISRYLFEKLDNRSSRVNPTVISEIHLVAELSKFDSSTLIISELTSWESWEKLNRQTDDDVSSGGIRPSSVGIQTHDLLVGSMCLNPLNYAQIDGKKNS